MTAATRRRVMGLAITSALSIGAGTVGAQTPPVPPPKQASASEAVGSRPKPAAARALRVGAQVGAVYAFDITMRTEAVNADGEFRAEMTMTQRVSSRTADELTWAVETATGAITSRGVFAGVENSLRSLNGFTMTRVTDARGQTKSLAVGDRVMASTGTPDITFPEQPVAPGESWTAEVEQSGRKATIRYTFTRVDTSAGRHVLIVEGVYEPGQFITTVAPSVFRLDATDCTTLDASGTMQMDMGGRIIRVTFTMTRQPTVPGTGAP